MFLSTFTFRNYKITAFKYDKYERILDNYEKVSENI